MCEGKQKQARFKGNFFFIGNSWIHLNFCTSRSQKKNFIQLN